jgi:hypothetical protein
MKFANSTSDKYSPSFLSKVHSLLLFALDCSADSQTTMLFVPSRFEIKVPDQQLELLKKKLELVTFPNELEEAQWDYGAPLADIKRLVSYWQDKFDWRAHEAAINAALPQFTMDVPVDGFEKINIHFVHQKSSVENAIPLIFVHGCKQPTKLHYMP